MSGPAEGGRGAALVARIAEAFNRREPPALDGLFAPGYVEHDREDFASFFGWAFGAFPDGEMRVEGVVEGGDRVGCRMVVRGTHRGELFGVAPTGRRVTLEGVDIFRVEGGLLAEHWGVADARGLMRQLGAER